MTKPLENLCKRVLAEHARDGKIRRAFVYAHTTVNAYSASATFRRKGTRRALFWEFAVEKLVELTANDPGLRIIEHYDTVSFIFDDLVLVRLKKADMALHTSNYPTQQAELFHVYQADLFGYQGLQRVEAVYVPNRFDTDILWAGIVAKDGDAHLWHFELAEQPAVSVVALPPPVQPPSSDLAKVKNPAKGGDQKKKDGTH